MMVRAWSGRVPLAHAEGFHAHLLATGVADYRWQAGCVEIRLWRRDEAGSALFTLVSTWSDMDAICAYAGDTPEIAVVYPDDDRFELLSDRYVTHYELIASEPGMAR